MGADRRQMPNLQDSPASVRCGRTFVFSDADLEAAIEDYREELRLMGLDETETKNRVHAVEAFFRCEGRPRENLVFQQARDISINNREE